MATVVTLLHYDSTHPFIYTPEQWKDMSLERVLTGHGRGEAEELGGRLVAVEHVHATCRADTGKCENTFTNLTTHTHTDQDMH